MIRLAIIGAVTAAIIAIAYSAWTWVEGMVTTIGTQKVVIAECAKGRKDLKDAVTESNAAMKALEAAIALREAAAQEAVDEAKVEAKRHADRAKALLAATPKAGVSSCDGARELMREYVLERRGRTP